MEQRSRAENNESELIQLTKAELEQRGYTPEVLAAAQEQVLRLAEAGGGTLDVSVVDTISPDGVDLDSAHAKKMALAFSEDSRKALRTAAAALVAAGGILAAPAWAGEQRDTIDQTGEVVKTYTLPDGTRQFEVSAENESMDIGTVQGFEKKTIDGRTVYQPLDGMTAPATLSIKLNVPANKKGTELVLRTNTSHDDGVQLLEGAGGSTRWVLGDDAAQTTNLSALAHIEGSVLSHKESVGKQASGWMIPVGLRIMRGQPGTETPATLGLSTGYAYWNSDLGKISGEVGMTFDPKTLQAILGNDALLAFSYEKKSGKLELNANVLSMLGTQGKTSGEVDVGLEIKRFATPVGDVTLSSGLGLSAEGADSKTGTTEKTRLHIRPAKISGPLLGQEFSLGFGITRDLYRGDTGGAFDFSVKPGK